MLTSIFSFDNAFIEITIFETFKVFLILKERVSNTWIFYTVQVRVTKEFPVSIQTFFFFQSRAPAFIDANINYLSACFFVFVEILKCRCT